MAHRSTTAPLRIAWVLAAFVAAAGAAWGAVAILFPPERVRARVQEQLATALAREVRFADASVGLWPPVRLTVRGFELAEPGGFDRGTALRAHSIHLDLDVFALLGRRLVARRLIVDRPALHLALGADGTTNLDGIVKPPSPGKPARKLMDVELQEFRIVAGRALVDQSEPGRRVTFALDTRVALRTERGGERISTSGETRVSGLAWGPMAAARTADLGGSMAKLEWKIEHRGAFDAKAKRLALERLALRLGRSALSLSGTVDEPGPRARLNLAARASDLELGDLLAFLSAADAKAVAGVKGSGRLGFDLAVRGHLGTGAGPVVLGSLRVRDGAFRYAGAPAGVSRLSLTARFAPDSLSIPDLAALVTDPNTADARAMAPVKASLLVTRFADPRVRFTISGDLDLAAVSPLLAARGTRLGGRARVALSGSGRARDPGTIALEGQARLSGASVESPSLPKKLEKIQGEIAFAPAQARVRGLSFAAGGSSVSLDATVTRPLALLAKPGRVAPAGVSFDLRSPNLDLAELLPTTPGEPLLPNVAGGGTVAIARLRNGTLDVKDVSARVELNPAVLVVPAYSFQGYGGAVAGSARFDLTDPAQPSFAVKARVDSVEADALLSAWTPARGWLHGALNTTLDLSGAGARPEDLKRTLTAAGLALVSNGTLGPGPALAAVVKATGIRAFEQVRFRDLKLPFRVERGRVITDPVVIEGDYGRWQLTGGLGFDGRMDYAVSVTLPPAAAVALGARSALAVGALSDPQGNILLDLRVSGPVAAPRVAWDSRAMRDRVAGKLSQTLVEQRQKMENEARISLEARSQAVADSVRSTLERARQSVRDSLRRHAGDLLKGFFGGGRKDTTGGN